MNDASDNGLGHEVVNMLDSALCYRALQTRDARFDGRFYTAVKTTGIYCRPICPARTPKLANCIFVRSAAAAHELGFRPCLRCRPEIAPGLAGFRGSANTVRRALSLIAEGAFNDSDVESFAERLGIGARHLRRLFDEHLGASPVAVAQTQRVLFAKRLLTETRLPMTEIALAAGFGSVRRFNDVFVRTYGRAPSQLRRKQEVSRALPGVRLKLPYSPPYDWPTMLAFFAPRAINGVEQVKDERYMRTFCIGEARGTVQVSKLPNEHALQAVIFTSDVRVLSTLVTRLRRVFDLDADASAIDAHLARDPQLKRRVRARPGLRVPGAWDPFELAVRAVLGQQVSVTAATTFARRLVASCGEPLAASEHNAETLDAETPQRVFPTPSTLRDADLSRIGLTGKRRETLQKLAHAVTEQPSLLEACATLDETIAKLVELPGIGPWTAQYIAMRALREPDAFPAADLGLLRAVAVDDKRPTPAQLLKQAEAWRPWRAYATLRLWLQ